MLQRIKKTYYCLVQNKSLTGLDTSYPRIKLKAKRLAMLYKTPAAIYVMCGLFNADGTFVKKSKEEHSLRPKQIKKIAQYMDTKYEELRNGNVYK